MYQHFREQLQAGLDAVESRRTQAQAELGAALLDRDLATGPVQAAAADLAQAVQARAAGQAEVDARWAEANHWTNVRDAAQAAVKALLDEGPILDGRGKPLPGWGIELRARRQHLASAAQSLTTAQQALTSAIAELARRTAVLNDAQRVHGEREAVAQAAQAVADDRTARLAQIEGSTQGLTGMLADLDRRESRIASEPMDFAEVTAAADAELQAALLVRQSRRRLWDSLQALDQRRATTLAEFDRVSDELPAIAAAARAGDGLTPAADLARVADLLDAVTARSRSQRGRPPGERTDDLRASLGDLDQAGAVLSWWRQASQAEADQRWRELEAAGAALLGVNQGAPIQ